jgi:hypothetical protein
MRKKELIATIEGMQNDLDRLYAIQSQLLKALGYQMVWGSPVKYNFRIEKIEESNGKTIQKMEM